jgi:hypothetical protein
MSNNCLEWSGIYPPPFLIGDNTILILIHIHKELIQFGARDGHPGFGKSNLEIGFIDFAVVITVNALEKSP